MATTPNPSGGVRFRFLTRELGEHVKTGNPIERLWLRLNLDFFERFHC